jgi:hypothetical protein
VSELWPEDRQNDPRNPAALFLRQKARSANTKQRPGGGSRTLVIFNSLSKRTYGFGDGFAFSPLSDWAGSVLRGRSSVPLELERSLSCRSDVPVADGAALALRSESERVFD